MKKDLFRPLIFAPFAIASVASAAAVTMIYAPTGYAPTGEFIKKNSATAWAWVAPDQQANFVEELREYARQKSLRFSSNIVPAPWKMIGMTLLTPMDNEISVINATAPDKFAVAMTVEHQGENWQSYWEDFRLYVSARHRWQDDLKPEQHEGSQ